MRSKPYIERDCLSVEEQPGFLEYWRWDEACEEWAEQFMSSQEVEPLPEDVVEIDARERAAMRIAEREAWEAKSDWGTDWD